MKTVTNSSSRLILIEPRRFRPFVAVLTIVSIAVVILSTSVGGWVLGLCALALFLMVMLPFIALSRLRAGRVTFDAAANTVTLTNRPADRHERRALSRLIKAEDDYDDDHVEGSTFCGTQLVFDTDTGIQRVALSKIRRDVRFEQVPTQTINDWLEQARNT